MSKRKSNQISKGEEEDAITNTDSEEEVKGARITSQQHTFEITVQGNGY